MRSIEELSADCAAMLRDLRSEAGLSKLRMANLLCVDDHTWARYETGKSAPSVPELLWLLSLLHKDALCTIIKYLYPERYNDESPRDIGKMRESLCYYMTNVASSRTIEEIQYFWSGHHGSNIVPQLEMITMYNHLPLELRLIVADLIDSLYAVATARGEIVNEDKAMPDVDVFQEALKMAQKAVEERRSSYTTICE